MLSKSHPDCLKITRIIQHSKWGIPTSSPQNVVNKEDEVAFNASYVYGESVGSKLGRAEFPPTFIGRTAIFGKECLAKLHRDLYNGFNGGGILKYGRMQQ